MDTRTTQTLKFLCRVICCACARCRKPELGRELVPVRYGRVEGCKSEVPIGMRSRWIFNGAIA